MPHSYNLCTRHDTENLEEHRPAAQQRAYRELGEEREAQHDEVPLQEPEDEARQEPEEPPQEGERAETSSEDSSSHEEEVEDQN
ncbi:hypothetical protein B9Z55_011021 [Caenorhabditis nigoni]|uniref:Uncharacterized protein n=1 Tax=Caenorhabditis nigoni TaxID=1611254 RepID=A0A2G5UIA8_9PELO|nr:hypothetical protein B9Z55_011021 [Caenorhabditis nigoni]